MAYRISQTDPAVLSSEELKAELDGFTALAVEVAERMSLILRELRNRRQAHPFFRHPVLRFFQDIADQNLDAEAAISLTNAELIRAVLPLARARQREISRGAELAVANIALDSRVETESMPIFRMDSATLRRVFGPDGIRSITDQAEIIRSEGRVERHGMITVLRDECLIKIGNQKIKPEDLRGPLLALGYTLDLSRDNPHHRRSA